MRSTVLIFVFLTLNDQTLTYIDTRLLLHVVCLLRFSFR